MILIDLPVTDCRNREYSSQTGSDLRCRGTPYTHRLHEELRTPLGFVRDREIIDSELRLLAAVRWSIREHGGEPSSRQVDELVDERLAHLGRAGEDVAVAGTAW